MGFAERLSQLPHPPAAWLFRPLGIVPWAVRNRSLAVALNKVFQEPLREGDFEALEGHWMHIAVTDLALDFYLTVKDNAFLLSKPRPCDVTIKGDSTSFLAMVARREDPDTLFFNRRLSIEGNTELGLAVKNMLDALEFEQLPDFVQWAIRKLDAINQPRFAHGRTS